MKNAMVKPDVSNPHKTTTLPEQPADRHLAIVANSERATPEE